MDLWEGLDNLRGCRRDTVVIELEKLTADTAAFRPSSALIEAERAIVKL